MNVDQMRAESEKLAERIQQNLEKLKEGLPEILADYTRIQEENVRLRRLDVEYGRVEEEIIMSDPHFDGDGPGDCGDRLIASVHRLRDRAADADRLEAELAALKAEHTV